MGVARERVYYDRFRVHVTNPGYQTVRSYNIFPDSLTRLEFTLIALQDDKVERATFKRVALLYRLGSGVVKLQGPTWETLETVKSNVSIDVKFILGSNTLSLQVKNATTTATVWLGVVNRLDIK